MPNPFKIGQKVRLVYGGPSKKPHGQPIDWSSSIDHLKVGAVYTVSGYGYVYGVDSIDTAIKLEEDTGAPYGGGKFGYDNIRFVPVSVEEIKVENIQL